jgi:hypothetical protein
MGGLDIWMDLIDLRDRETERQRDRETGTVAALLLQLLLLFLTTHTHTPLTTATLGHGWSLGAPPAPAQRATERLCAIACDLLGLDHVPKDEWFCQFCTVN